MADRIDILTGPAASGKTTALLARYRSALQADLAAGRFGRTLWLAPTNRARSAIRDRLLDESLPVAFQPNVLTFDGFADRVLRTAPQPVMPLTSAMQRTLLRQIVDGLQRDGRLRHFTPISGTAGFLDLVSGFIAELKRDEIWPEEFDAACKARGATPRDRELGVLYHRYQELLLSKNVFDGEGRFWSVREILKDGHFGPFAELSLVVVDGFTDFTHTQYEILAMLAARAEAMHVALLLDGDPPRSDLFAKTAGGVERLRHATPVEWQSVRLEETSQSRGGKESKRPIPSREQKSLFPDPAPRPVDGSPLPPSLSHIARWLFANPLETPRSAAVEGLELMAVAGPIGEVNLLAARVKQLLRKGVGPSEIVVAFRDLDDYADLVGEVFSAAGIPFASEAGLPLSRVPIGKALSNVLHLEAEDWPFARLMSVLDSNFVRPDWAEWADGRGVRDVAAALRRLSLAEGRESILQVLARVASQTESEATPDEESPEIPLRLLSDRALKLLQRLSEALEPLRKNHDLDGWSKITAQIAADLGLLRNAENSAPEADTSSAADRRDWETLTAVLFDAARAERLGTDKPRQLSLAEFLPIFTDLLHQQKLSPSVKEEGRIRVLSAEQVRNLDVPYLFLAGLTERSFPQHKGDDCLYTEAERRELNQHGLSLGHRAVRAREEMLMFYGIVTRARKHLLLTYPAVTSDGKPLSPSPYLLAIQDLFDPNALQCGLDERLDPVPAEDRVLSPADARIRGMADLLENRPALFRSVCHAAESQSVARNVLAAVDMNVARFHTPGFTNFEGRLENPANIDRLRRHFHREREFSATQLEAYADCPFRFFLSHVLGVGPLAAPGVATDYLRRGTLVHDILADLHRQFRDDGKVPPTGETVSERFHRLLQKQLGEHPDRKTLHAALRRIEERLLLDWGAEYGKQWDSYLAAHPESFQESPRPSLFETPFGHPPSRPGDPDQPAPALTFGSGENEVHVGGRIDRIDVGATKEETLFTVVDYKTGRSRPSHIEDIQAGRTLQLALYTLAVYRLQIVGPEATPFQMGYWHIREEGFLPGIKEKPGAPEGLSPVDRAVWTALAQTLDELIPRLASGIRSGTFPVFNADEHCTGRCPFNTVCRVAQIRSLPDELSKTWTP